MNVHAGRCVEEYEQTPCPNECSLQDNELSDAKRTWDADIRHGETAFPIGNKI